MALVEVADCAYPHDDWSFLPASIEAVAGYVGGRTPHSWSGLEVAHAEATGRPWWGIWTAPVGRALTLADAYADARGMVAGLVALGRPKDLPVFWDVEYSTWNAGPVAAEQAGRSWCLLMNEAGYPRAWWYGPCRSSAGWRACWTGAAPSALPPGVVGVQYDHALAGDRYDVSVFDAAAVGLTGPGGSSESGGGSVFAFVQVVPTGTVPGMLGLVDDAGRLRHLSAPEWGALRRLNETMPPGRAVPLRTITADDWLALGGTIPGATGPAAGAGG